MKVRIKVGDSVDVIQRNVRGSRQFLQLVRGQIAVLVLNRAELLKNIPRGCHE